MHTPSLLFLLTSAAALLPLALAEAPAGLKFCFNGKDDDASCINTQITQPLFNGKCKRPPVMNAPGQKIFISKVTILDNANEPSTVECQLYSDISCLVKPDNKYQECAQRSWSTGACEVVADAAAGTGGLPLGSYSCYRL
ncbi:hypothetical protein LTR70_007255 [Exophiala xenobiotica]|uniref:Uncharacterized protein n=1 Tax=Lithohypha guttulata TaxID=1690604 RepID=A0ABR0K4R8_9EURO|nr:hypothetical protein LTR24_006839 [Lithohypha guttulata]KAK5314281.1 hypothetical protein LTR70_007255 [Exophiala xenobiotica]